jgi:uncharacterized protein (TIGR03085 family)
MPTAQLARSERTGLCDLLNELGPEAATLCDGWLTKDLAAHLFVRERRPLAMPGLLVGGALAKLTDVSMESALRSHGYDALVAKVRSGPPLLARRLDEIVNLAEFFVHFEDVRRAAPAWERRDDPALDSALWALLGRRGRMLARKVRGAGLELERPDGERIVARRAEPRAVLRGGVQDLVLFLCGRDQVAEVVLGGTEEAQRSVREAGFRL